MKISGGERNDTSNHIVFRAFKYVGDEGILSCKALIPCPKVEDGKILAKDFYIFCQELPDHLNEIIKRIEEK